MAEANFKYDVAISFLAHDERIAEALYSKLASGLEIFFFPRNQEDLAGTDGMESMRTPFLREARVIVVLYREPWGDTPWTRVEETAIKERCLNKGWESLFFVTLDPSRPTRPWVPPTHVRYNYDDFGVEQAVGAIKARVKDLGGRIEPLSALRQAELLQKETELLQYRKAAFSDHHWIRNTVQPAIEGVFHEMLRISEEASAKHNLGVVGAFNPERCVLTNGIVSLAAAWRQRFVNELDSARLIVTTHLGRLSLPGEQGMFHLFGLPPEIGAKYEFGVELSLTRDLRWADADHRSELITGAQLADRCLGLMIAEIGKANRGEYEDLRIRFLDS